MKRIIIHQVNCQGVMGAGFAKQIKDAYPACYLGYRDLCLKFGTQLLGKIYVYDDEDDIIINLFSQDKYGKDKRYTDYSAMKKGLETVRKMFPNEEIIAPYKIGCGLAGGDWNIVYPILKQYNITISKNIEIKGD